MPSKTFDQYLAESGQQSKLDDLRRTGGYDQARSQYESTGSFGSLGGNSSNFEDALRRAQEITKQTFEPVINTFKSQIPKVEETYKNIGSNLEAQRKPLADRYKQLLDTVKGQQTQSVNRQTLATNNELGKRGILGSSGAAQQEIINATEPINQAYTAQANDVGFQGEQAQRDITTQQTNLSSEQLKSIQAIENAIAQAQLGQGNSAVGLAGDFVNNALAQQQAQEAARQRQADNDFNKLRYDTIELPSAQANIKNINSEISNRNKTSNAMTAQDFLSSFNSGALGNSAGTGKLSIGSNVVNLLKNGDYQVALALAMNP